MKKKNIFICCTEQSGENICYNILKRLDLNNINIDGVCGSLSQKFVNNKYYDISEFKSLGLIEIILSIKKYLKMINFLTRIIIKKNYDLVICIDSPDFNYNLVKSLRKNKFNNNIIQIVAPTVWAWRGGRAKKFADLYDEIFLLFNFEKKFFDYPNINTSFIGHPVYHIKKRSKKNNINYYKYIAFLPGSRENEINKLFKYFDLVEKYLRDNNLNWKIFIPTLPHLTEKIKIKISSWQTETILIDNIKEFEKYYEYVFISITCSGTATLEIAKRNIPQLIIYKLNFITALLLKLFIKVRNACILNIVSNKMIIPELINSKLTKKNLINYLQILLNNTEFRDEQIRNINHFLPLIETDICPYELSIKRINSLL